MIALLSFQDTIFLAGGVTVVLIPLYLLSRTERHLPARAPHERAEPIDYHKALRVRDRSRRGPVAEDFQGKTKIGRAA